MKMMVAFSQQRQLQPRVRLWSAIAALALTAGSLIAQSPAVRIPAEINSSEQTVLPGSKHPMAQAQLDAGRVPADTKLTGVTIFFNRSPQQEAALKALIQAQQTPGSPQFHQWLTPDQFAARFGMADADIEKVQGWLERQGFAVDSINRSRNAIHFSGTVAQVEQAFATEMHYYNVAGVKHFAPSTALSVPTAIAPVVSSVLNLNSFRPRPMHIHSNSRPKSVKPNYTITDSNGNQDVFFAPGDIKKAYDMNAPIAAGNNGSGQTIAIMGQSAIQTVDIENFQQAAGLTVKDPNPILVPNTGSSTVQADGDEGESDIDIEWSGATAPGAEIDFVYTGGATVNGQLEFGVFDSYQYAVDNKIGDIISLSYGSCETQLDENDFTTFESWGEQATSQGQTVVASSGDSGATACYGYTGTTDGGTTWTTAMQDALAVNYPASSAYVTGTGGTEITAANDAVGQYWAASGSSGLTLTSALSYIPEIAWNDDSLTAVSGCSTNYQCVSASGGGASALTPRPSWQANVTGIPSGTMRLVPDVALYSSPNYPGYLFCTSDSSDWYDGSQGGPAQTASCGNSEFYDPTYGYLTIAGGTSFAAPIFAGELAILNQAKGYTTGQGLVNTELYALAATSAYSTAFHDVTSGNNGCSGSGCPNTSGFSAGTGYDEVTGLGSLDLNNLITAWPESTTTLIGTTTTVAASNTAPSVSQSVSFTITVAAVSGTTTPTGTVSVSVDGTAVSGSPFTLTSNGTYVYSTSFSTADSHSVTASYAGDTTFGTSTGSVTVNVQGTSSGKGTFSMAFSPSTLTVSQGSQGTETLTVTPSGGYTGTVVLSYDTSNDNALANLCLEGGNNITSNGDIVVSNSSAVAGQIIVDTNASDCVSSAAVAALAKRGLHVIPHAGKAANTTASSRNRGSLPVGLALAGLLLAGFLGRSSRKLRALACVIALAAIGLAMSACGSTNTNNTITNPPKGTYTITFTGADQSTSTITSSASFTLTID
jgi:subtilase family serine protease